MKFCQALWCPRSSTDWNRLVSGSQRLPGRLVPNRVVRRGHVGLAGLPRVHRSPAVSRAAQRPRPRPGGARRHAGVGLAQPRRHRPAPPAPPGAGLREPARPTLLLQHREAETPAASHQTVRRQRQGVREPSRWPNFESGALENATKHSWTPA